MLRITHRVSVVLAIVVTTIFLACGSGSSSQSETAAENTAAAPTPAVRSLYPLTVPAGEGRSVTFTRAPQRIVSLSPGATEVLFAIGAGGQVIGTDRFSDYPEAAKTLPKLEYTNTNIEALVALRPDLVVAAGRQRSLVPVFEQAGLTVLPMEEPNSIAGVIDRVRMMGQITDHAADAEDLASNLEGRVAAVTEKVASVTAGPRVYHEVDPKLYAAAPNSFVGDVYTVLKAQNIVPAGDNPYPQISAESIISADPEVIIAGSRLPESAPAEVKRRPGWNVVSAVKNDRIYEVEDNLISRPGPRVVDALEQLARQIYPDRFR
ncbi:MAG: ABC transporter substrate-binding protein [Dehalococcoidia bacterium]